MYRRVARRTGIARPLVLTVVAALVVSSVGAIAVLLAATHLGNPFSSTTTEQPNAVVLAKMHDLARFDAATGRFTTLVDQKTDTAHVPGWVKGQHVVLSAEGDVDATVDLSHLDGNAIQLSNDGRTATVHVPRPTLSDPHLDLQATRVIARDRGVLDRIDAAVTDGNPTDDHEIQERATEKLRAAANESDLQARAESNTERFLEKTLHAAGVEKVDVVFDGPDAAQAA